MKKTLRKIVAAAAAGIVSLTMAFPAFAAGTTYTKVNLTGTVGDSVLTERKVYIDDKTDKSAEFSISYNVYDVSYAKDSAKTYDYTDGKIYCQKISASATHTGGHDYMQETVITPKDATDKIEISGTDSVLVNGLKAYNYELKDNILTVRDIYENSIKIRYSLGDLDGKATVPVDSTLYPSGTANITLKAAPAVTGYNFLGWKEKNSDGTYAAANAVPAGNLITVTGNGTHEFVAQWSKITDRTVKFDANGITDVKMPSDICAVVNTEVTLTAASADGYTFKEWNTSKTGTGTSYPASSKIKVADDDITLYAIWIKNADNTKAAEDTTKQTETSDPSGNTSATVSSVTGDTDIYVENDADAASAGSASVPSTGSSGSVAAASAALMALACAVIVCLKKSKKD